MSIRFAKAWTTSYSQGRLYGIEVQVLIRKGLPRFDIIGLPQNMIREGKDRILASLHHLGVHLPAQKILVHLTPGDIPKEGTHFDLPILAALLEALGLNPSSTTKDFYWGELQLNGELRPTPEFIAHLLYSHSLGAERAIGSKLDSFVFDLKDYLRSELQSLQCAEDLLELSPRANTEAYPLTTDESLRRLWLEQEPTYSLWNRLKGSTEQFEFWAMASLGRLHVLLESSPGVGKTSWCRALRELQRPLLQKDWSEKFRYIRSKRTKPLKILQIAERAYESPHHSSSTPAMIGGGSGHIVAGAISRAHMGILFLDEFAEFRRDVLEALREPLEEKRLTIARQGLQESFPADIQLLAAMNSCKCGRHSTKAVCTCSSHQFWSYRTKISEPLKDRFHSIIGWHYIDKEAPHSFRLVQLRRRLLEAENLAPPKFRALDLSEIKSPRRQRLWLQSLLAWARWKNISEITQSDHLKAHQFFKQMEVKNHDE